MGSACYGGSEEHTNTLLLLPPPAKLCCSEISSVSNLVGRFVKNNSRVAAKIVDKT